MPDIVSWLGKGSTLTDAERGLLTLLKPMAEDAVRNYVGYTMTQGTFTHFLPESDQWGVDSNVVDVINNRVVTGGEMSDTDALALPELPVRSITTAHEDRAAYAGQGASDFAAATLLTAGTDYFLDLHQSGVSFTGHLMRIGTNWPNKRGTVKVVYVAGYTAAELDGTATGSIRATPLRMACVLTVAAAFIEAAKHGTSPNISVGGPLAAESISTSGHSVKYADNSVNLIAGLMIDLPPKARQILQPYRRIQR